MSEVIIESLDKLTKNIKRESVKLGPREARFLVDGYYMMQRNRIRADHQIRTLEENKEPNKFLQWHSTQSEIMERNVKAALGAYSAGNPIGQWAESIVGIGPVISAGLLAMIDMKLAPTAGHIWRYAGLDPTVKWLGAEKGRALVTEVMQNVPNWSKYEELIPVISMLTKIKPENILKQALHSTQGEPLDKVTKESLINAVARRPWNAKLKRLCWITGESFVKFSSHKNDVYGKIYLQRKELETQKNDNFEYKELAEQSLKEKSYGDDTLAKKEYVQGKLPKARIHARAKRYAVKLFLSHWHWVAYETTFKEKPPKPYILNQPNHIHFVAPPNWPILN